TLTFAPGEDLKQIRIPIIDDTLVEAQESISLVLTNPTGGLPLGGQRLATLLIDDNDIAFQFVTNLFQVNENGTNAVITIERVGQTNAVGSVVFSTIQGTAQAGVDFVATNLNVVFDAGETNKTVLLPINDDELFEGDESLTLVLSQPSSNAALGLVFTATLVITDDECAIGFASLNFSTNEYAGFATVVVRRTGGTVNPVSVNYATVDGTASGTDPNNLDYVAQTGTLNFNGDQFAVSSNG